MTLKARVSTHVYMRYILLLNMIFIVSLSLCVNNTFKTTQTLQCTQRGKITFVFIILISHAYFFNGGYNSLNNSRDD